VGFPDRQGKLGLRNALGGLILSIFERSLVFKVNTQNEFHLRLFQTGELRERVRNISGTVPLDLGSFVFRFIGGREYGDMSAGTSFGIDSELT
jgi:hypothetical protein